MRPHIIALVAAAMFTIPTTVLAQQFEIGPGGVRVEPHGYRHYEGRSAYRGRCAELRRSCLHKEELGEQGLGNCSRYRELCR